MSSAAERINAFETSALLPALAEICESPALLREYSAETVTRRPAADDAVEYLLAQLAGAIRRQAGPSLALKNRSVPPDLSPLAGLYVMTVFYDVDEEQVFASPAVLFWMRFNNKLHIFNHRYDNDVARHSVEDVTRPHVLNHVLRSFDFYKIYAFPEKPFPGYR